MTFFNLGHSVQLHFTIGQNLLNINKNTIDQAIEEFIDNLPKFIQSELKRLG